MPSKVPRAKKPAAPPVPAPAQLPPHYRVFVFAALIATAAFALYVIINGRAEPPSQPKSPVSQGEVVSGTPQTQNQREARTLVDLRFRELAQKTEFDAWLTEWQKLDPYLKVGEFTFEGEAEIGASLLGEPEPTELTAPRTDRYVWSPMRVRAADYLGGYGEPDSRLTLYTKASAQLELLEGCGTPCSYDGAFWLDDNRLVFLGSIEAMTAEGVPLCLGAEDPNQCFRHLTVTLFDFSVGTKWRYQSDRHRFGGNPFAVAKHDRWVAGLTAEERSAMAEAPSGQAIVLRGKISDIDTASGIIGITSNGSPRFLALSPSAVVHDAAGDAKQSDVLKKGDTVEILAVRSTVDASLTAVSVKVLF